MPRANLNQTAELWRSFPHTFAERMSGYKWKPYSYLQMMSLEIMKAVSKGNGRIIVSIPPRHGKSELISHWIPFWFLDQFPDQNIILASYEADFASHWGRKVRNEIEANPLTKVKIASDSSAANRWNTDKGGGMFTAGVGGPITGRGGQLLIIDDPVKNWIQATSKTYQESTYDWFKSTFYTRAEPGATIVLVMTRWTKADLAGRILEDPEFREKWTEINIPAIAEDHCLLGRPPGSALCPDRYDLSSLLDIKKQIGTRMFSALYQQQPTEQEGGIVKRVWIKHWRDIPSGMEEMVQSWDLTFKDGSNSDFVVGTVIGRKGSEKYVLDMVRGRMDIVGTMNAMISLSSKWHQAGAKLIENKANGPAVEQMLKSKLSGIILVEPEGGKESRLNAVSPQFEAGNVYLPPPETHPWVHDMVEELVNFPNAAHDDIVDSLSQGLYRLEQSNSRQVGGIRIIRR